jgi:4-hydroxy-3-polyprenylbenzoate decarboxylase
MMSSDKTNNLVIAISGASGAIYGIRLLEVLKDIPGIHTHLVISNWARKTIAIETDYSVSDVLSLGDTVYEENDMAAAISSGSYPVRGMVVVPASMKTVAGIACGFGTNLIIRAADVSLKENRRLVLVPRESPLNAIHLENLLKLARLGVTILPAVPGFYTKPESIEDIVNHTVGKILDQFDIPHNLFRPWGQDILKN